MRATLSFIRVKYAEFNKLCFDSTLPEVPLKIGTSRRTLGTLRYCRRVVFGKLRYSDFVITISSRFDLPQDVIEDTLIHEMIHLYLCVNDINDGPSHGPRFRTMMHAINQRFGRNITISHSSSEEERATDVAIRNHYICISHWESGETLLTCCARTRIFELHRDFSRIPEIKSFEWKYSSNPHFNRFPTCRILKFYRISAETLSALADSIPCVCDGRSFQPAQR